MTRPAHQCSREVPVLEESRKAYNQVRIVGMIGVTREAQATSGAPLSVFGGGINPGAEVPAGVDGDYILEFARVHEDACFDMVLTGYSSSTPDGFEVAGYAAAHTTRLGYLIAHRPGFVAPTLAARKAATLDQLTGGRIALHIISGGSDLEQERDGDFLDHDGRYRRTDEYMEILRRTWIAAEPTPLDAETIRTVSHGRSWARRTRIVHDGRNTVGMDAASSYARPSGSTTALVPRAVTNSA